MVIQRLYFVKSYVQNKINFRVAVSITKKERAFVWFYTVLYFCIRGGLIFLSYFLDFIRRENEFLLVSKAQLKINLHVKRVLIPFKRLRSSITKYECPESSYKRVRWFLESFSLNQMDRGCSCEQRRMHLFTILVFLFTRNCRGCTFYVNELFFLVFFFYFGLYSVAY